VAQGFVVELLAQASQMEQRWAAAEKRAAAMGRHGTPQLTQRLKAAGTHIDILMAQGGDGWPAHLRQFGRSCHTGE
jgi:hypothetical protein